MSSSSSTSTVEKTMVKVEEIAALAGYKVSRPAQMPDSIQVAFDMGGGRSQNVFIHHAGATAEGQDVVQFLSPCMVVKKGLFKGIGKSQALNLLNRNANLLWGYFAVTSAGDTEGVMVCSTQIVDTMEVEEFRAHVNYLAVIADGYEREHGLDQF